MLSRLEFQLPGVKNWFGIDAVWMASHAFIFCKQYISNVTLVKIDWQMSRMCCFEREFIYLDLLNVIELKCQVC